jgi:hypothetical protein
MPEGSGDCFFSSEGSEKAQAAPHPKALSETWRGFEVEE